MATFYFSSSVIYAQDTLKDKTELVDVYVSGGSSRFPVFSMSQGDFKEMVPRSKILSGPIMQVNFNDFDNDSAGGYYTTAGRNASYAQLGITLRLKNKEFRKAGPWLKMGLNYFSSAKFLNTGVFMSEKRSAANAYFVGAVPVTRNTVTRQSVVYAYSCESLNLESAVIYKLNPNGVFSLFGGPGAFAGMNFGGKARIVSTTETTIEDYLQLSASDHVLYKSDVKLVKEKEEFDLIPNAAFGLFINVGVDLRLGNNYDYIKNTHLFFEVKPMFRAYAVKGGGLQSSVILVGNMGLRYALE